MKFIFLNHYIDQILFFETEQNSSDSLKKQLRIK